MSEIHCLCGEWNFSTNQCVFVVDVTRGGSIIYVDPNISFHPLAVDIFEDYEVDANSHLLILSYTVKESAINNQAPIYIRNDRQLKGFMMKNHEFGEVIQLLVTFLRKNTPCGNDVRASNSQRQDQMHPPGHPFVCPVPQIEVPLATGDGFTQDNQEKDKGKEKADEGEVLYVGKYYHTKPDLIKDVQLYALKENFEFRTRRSNKSRIQLGCVDENCTWRFVALSVENSEGFLVHHYVCEHSCDTTFRNVNHRQATAKILGYLISNNYAGGKVGLKPRQIIEKARKDHGVTITYSKAYRAQEHATEVVRGSPDENYKILPRWFHVLKEKNPGSAVFLEFEPDSKFKYAFLSFDASIKGFKLLRKIIAIDGAFLKAKFRGTLLAATAQDGNFQLFPIAFGIVDSENDDSWLWFFRCLKSIVPDESDLVFVSDRAPSIANGISSIYPLSQHSICAFHFEKNIASRFRSSPVLSLVHDAARVYTKTEFDYLMDEIKKANPELADYVEAVGIYRWSRAYSPVNRYNIMTTNIAESLNSMLCESREYPIVFLLETIRSILTKWFHDRHEKALAHKHGLTPEVGKIMKRVYEMSCALEVCHINEYLFEVKGDSRNHIVDLNLRHCSCRKFDLDGYPCIHAFAAAKRAHIPENSLVTDFYSNERLIQLYSESIYPVGDEADWNIPEHIAQCVCLPPSTRVPSGRRKKKRFPSFWEIGSSGKYKCSRCGEKGHRKNKCSRAI